MSSLHEVTQQKGLFSVFKENKVSPETYYPTLRRVRVRHLQGPDRKIHSFSYQKHPVDVVLVSPDMVRIIACQIPGCIETSALEHKDLQGHMINSDPIASQVAFFDANH